MARRHQRTPPPHSVGTVLDVSGYVPGLYFLRIRTAMGEVVTRALAVKR